MRSVAGSAGILSLLIIIFEFMVAGLILIAIIAVISINLDCSNVKRNCDEFCKEGASFIMAYKTLQ